MRFLLNIVDHQENRKPEKQQNFESLEIFINFNKNQKIWPIAAIQILQV